MSNDVNQTAGCEHLLSVLGPTTRAQVEKQEQREKPEGIHEFEEALLLAIMLFTLVTWVAVLMRLLSG